MIALKLDDTTAIKDVIILSNYVFNVSFLWQLGGIVTPNDGLCHVDPVTGEYMIDKLQVS